MAKVMVEILSDPLQLQRYQESVADPGAGATATFTGTTRDTFEGKSVVQLEYEAYEPMAKKALQVNTHRQHGDVARNSRGKVAHIVTGISTCVHHCSHRSGLLQS